jgi:nicotinamide mononucleotide transporter
MARRLRLAQSGCAFHNRRLTSQSNEMNETLHIAGYATTPLELISFVLSIATVLLNIRRVHWAWLFAIVSSATYAVVFFDARLYGDAGLQGVFIATAAWGWAQWLRGGGGGDGSGAPLAVTRLDARGWTWSLAGWALGYLALSAFLQRFTDTDVPHLDAFLTAGSLLGTLLTARKKVENWHVWIVVDIVYVGLYVHKALNLTAVLYALFVAMAVAGLRVWSAAARAGAR